jgi:hypothetical protein
LSPESYSLNVPVRNPQLPNYLHSSEDTDKLHRPENEKVMRIKSMLELKIMYVPSCKKPQGRLPFVAQE